MRVLSVQIDQEFADFRELAERRGATIDLRTAAALGVEHAPDSASGDLSAAARTGSGT